VNELHSQGLEDHQRGIHVETFYHSPIQEVCRGEKLDVVL